MRRAFRATSLWLHPDKSGSSDAFAAAAEAHEVLSHPARRRAYDTGEDVHTEQPFTWAEEMERYYFPERRGTRRSTSAPQSTNGDAKSKSKRGSTHA